MLVNTPSLWDRYISFVLIAHTGDHVRVLFPLYLFNSRSRVHVQRVLLVWSNFAGKVTHPRLHVGSLISA